MMANMMGSYGVWVRDGVTGRGFVSVLAFMFAKDRLTDDQSLYDAL
jgi:phosphatidylglycerophosphatase GEP4